MTEHTGNTQPLKPLNEDDTQPIKPLKKPSRWKSILIGLLGFLLLVGLGSYSGYRTGIGDRVSAERSVRSQQLLEQYQYALVDIEFKRYEIAKQRLEYILSIDASYPGVSEKLTEVLVLISVPTPTTAPTLTATPDFSGAESAYERAHQLILAQDWPGALAALDTIRKLDPTYKTAQVDGMYYFALRNYGVDLINKQGNLEGGIYQLSLAERFGPLDRTADGLREGARLYITGASFWELDWSQAVLYFSQVGTGWPSLWDGTMTGSQRYFYASMRYGDDLYERQEYCQAYEQYQIAASMGQLESGSAGQSADAFNICYPATPTLEATATLEILPTDIPSETPTP